MPSFSTKVQEPQLSGMEMEATTPSAHSLGGALLAGRDVWVSGKQLIAK